MKRSVLTILLLIPLTMLIPIGGFGAEPPQGLVLTPPAYIGTLTAEWQPTGTNECSSGLIPDSPLPCGDVVIYGKLNRTGKGGKHWGYHYKHTGDIIISKKEPITIKADIAQVDFLNVNPAYLKLDYGVTFPLRGPGTFFAVLNTNDLSYKSATLCTVDVVVMEMVAPQPE